MTNRIGGLGSRVTAAAPRKRGARERADRQDFRAAVVVGPVSHGQRQDAGDEDHRQRQQAHREVREREVHADVVERDGEDRAVELIDRVEDEQDDKRPHAVLPDRRARRRGRWRRSCGSGVVLHDGDIGDGVGLHGVPW